MWALEDVQAVISQTQETARITPLFETVATAVLPASHGTQKLSQEMAESAVKHTGSKTNVAVELLHGVTPLFPAELEVALAVRPLLAAPVALMVQPRA